MCNLRPRLVVHWESAFHFSLTSRLGGLRLSGLSGRVLHFSRFVFSVCGVFRDSRSFFAPRPQQHVLRILRASPF